MKKPKSRMDEIELAKSIFDEIAAETESEDWDKPKKKPQKESTASNKNGEKSKAQEQV